MSDITALLGTALNNDMLAMRVISQNLANINTDGYKSEIAFSSLLTPPSSLIAPGNEANQALTMGSNLPSIDSLRDLQQGSLRYSGSDFDIAIEGNGFFEVSTNYGPRITRQGNMTIDREGRLSLLTGEVIEGEGGQIRLQNSPFDIDKEGVVSQGGRDLDRIRVVAFSNPEQLQYEGGGIFNVPQDAALVPEPFVGSVMQGYVETSNVRSADEIIRMIEVSRHFETTHKVLKGYDGMLDSAINVLGDL